MIYMFFTIIMLCGFALLLTLVILCLFGFCIKEDFEGKEVK